MLGTTRARSTKTVERRAAPFLLGVDKYYAENTSGFETAELDRIFVPAHQKKASKDGQPDSKKDDDSGEAAGANAVLKQRADAIRARAAAGQDFEMLQKEAYESAGAEGQPSTHLGKVSANDLPAAHRTILGLKEGELSEPISDPGGYYIYKVGRKSLKPVDQVRPEIKAILSQMLSRRRCVQLSNRFGQN